MTFQIPILTPIPASHAATMTASSYTADDDDDDEAVVVLVAPVVLDDDDAAAGASGLEAVLLVEAVGGMGTCACGGMAERGVGASFLSVGGGKRTRDRRNSDLKTSGL